VFGANYTEVGEDRKSFELCNDSELLRSYYSLREQCYRRELGLADFDGAEEQADRVGDLLIAHSGGRCLGGARIARLESVAVQLEESMLPPGQSCVWERLVLNPDYRSLDLARQICDQLVMASWQLGYDQALVLSSLRNARFYRRCWVQ
jgi:GNAT superfamily N-acetyltransferase